MKPACTHVDSWFTNLVYGARRSLFYNKTRTCRIANQLTALDSINALTVRLVLLNINVMSEKAHNV